MGFAKLLQTGRQIWRITDQRELAAGAFSDQIADDNQAGGDTNPHFNPCRSLERQFRNEPDDFQGGLDRAFGAVLVCGRKSEVGENAITHVAADTAIKSDGLRFQSISETRA